MQSTVNAKKTELLVSDTNRDLLPYGRDFIRTFMAGNKVVIVSGSGPAADELVYSCCSSVIRGIHRFSLRHLAGEIARPSLAASGVVSAERLPLEAIIRHLLHECEVVKQLTYFGDVATTPHFPAAVYRTLDELRWEGIGPDQLAGAGRAGPDLAILLRAYEKALATRGLADGAAQAEQATLVLRSGNHPLCGLPVLMHCVPVRHERERNFLEALVETSPAVMALAAKDQASDVEKLLKITRKTVLSDVSNCAASVRRHLFASEPAPERASDNSFELFAAAAESLECAEIARRVLKLASEGIPFDRMAILLRSPVGYVPVLEEAFGKAAIDTYFSHGVQRPHSAGRALLALLEFAREGYPASRFVEYLSLDEMPYLKDGSEMPVMPLFWEQIVHDTAVIGGRARWDSRLGALETSLASKLSATSDSDEQEQLQRNYLTVGVLKKCVLAFIDRLDQAPHGGDWGAWLNWLGELASDGVRDTNDIDILLQQLEPLTGIPSVSLDSVVLMLSDHLRTLPRRERRSRYGRVFIGSPGDVIGMDFDAVFVPGLAEGSFPRQIVEDPLLLDEARALVSPLLRTFSEAPERELLLAGVNACSGRLFASWSQMELLSGRRRVPSLYPFELVRAAGRRYTEPRQLEIDARSAVQTRAAWPAPLSSAEAIDAAEFDLAMLQPHAIRTSAKGAMAYVQKLPAPLYRSLKARYLRWERNDWNHRDGFGRIEHPPALASYSLKARPYSASALEDYSACPYRFYLRNIVRLKPANRPAQLWRIDRAIRGDIYHRAAARFTLEMIALASANHSLEDQLTLLDSSLAEVEKEFREEIAPAVESVWQSDMNRIRNDLRGVVRQRSLDTQWKPVAAEFGFGLTSSTLRDPASVPEVVETTGGFQLLGSVDLIERREDGRLRIIDYKTRSFSRRDYYDENGPLRVKGGALLQPLLYGTAVGRLFGASVYTGSLYFATIKGRYEIFPVFLTAESEAEIETVLQHIEEAVTGGFLVAAPEEDACEFCDYRPVCGPYEEVRAKRKKRLGALHTLRSLR
jgi:ATP-dependent helicase/nuclease subunit B